MKRRITKEELGKVKELSLLSYFRNYDPDELIKNGRTDYTTRTHSSLHLSNGLWFYWRTGVGGRTALDYFIKVEEYSFLDAALLLRNLIKTKNPIIEKQKTRECIRFKLPDAYINNQIVIDYLVNTRKIDREIVDELIAYDYIYESAYDHAVVFVGRDEFNSARYAMKRATDSNMKKDVFGSSKEYSFSLSNPESDILHVFESVIDLLSYLTLKKLDYEDYKKGNYLSLSGVGGKGLALESYLKKHGNIKYLFLHLDNDEAGTLASQTIKEQYQSKYYVFDKRVGEDKDINEMLVNLLK